MFRESPVFPPPAAMAVSPASGAGRPGAADGRVAGTLKLDLGGTIRHCTPQETFARVRPLFPMFGITRLANVTGLDRVGSPVWLCIRPHARCLSVSQGKGLDDDLARVSAVMESIELHHAEDVAPPDMVASYREARRRHAVMNPARLAPGGRGRADGPPRKIAWIRGRALGAGGPVLGPHVRANENWSRPHPDAGLFSVTTTGLASGNHRLEAICHGLFEVVERDSEWRGGRPSPAAQPGREARPPTGAAPPLPGPLDRVAAAAIPL